MWKKKKKKYNALDAWFIQYVTEHNSLEFCTDDYFVNFS
jgi:hypothetical protein